jgi:hypothetical protein
MVFETVCIEFELRSRILLRVIIPAYRSSYDGTRIVQTYGLSDGHVVGEILEPDKRSPCPFYIMLSNT